MLAAILFSLLAPSHSYAVNETDLPALAPAIIAHYNSGESGFFKTADGLALSYHINRAANETGAVVVVNGRDESHLKYAELIYDLNQMGLSVFTYDHRGQGLSEGHLASHPDRDYIVHFDDMATDLNVFVKSEVVTKAPLYLLGHSMGGLVSARFLELYPTTAKRFRAAALNSPAIGIQTGYPDLIAEPLACLLLKGTDYAPGEGPYVASEDVFADNGVTSSVNRFEFEKSRMQSVPGGANIGGVTNRWVCETINAGHGAIGQAPFLNVSLLITASLQDSLVRSPDEQFFCSRSPKCRIKGYAGQHELLMEADPIRSQVLHDIVTFFTGAR